MNRLLILRTGTIHQMVFVHPRPNSGTRAGSPLDVLTELPRQRLRLPHRTPKEKPRATAPELGFMTEPGNSLSSLPHEEGSRYSASRHP